MIQVYLAFIGIAAICAALALYVDVRLARWLASVLLSRAAALDEARRVYRETRRKDILLVNTSIEQDALRAAMSRGDL